MPLLGSSWRENVNTHGLPQPSPGSRHSWPLVLSYLWLFLAFNFAAGTRLCSQEDPASQADSSQRGRKMSKLSKPSARVPGSEAGHLRRYTRAWLLGANLHTAGKAGHCDLLPLLCAPELSVSLLSAQGLLCPSLLLPRAQPFRCGGPLWDLPSAQGRAPRTLRGFQGLRLRRKIA